MLLNMIAAGVAGALVPVVLRWLRIDPALASAVIVTTVTDCCGFFFFLGLATLMMGHLR
jgi:magnesium transporter